jgi:L-serine kinase (ADP)
VSDAVDFELLPIDALREHERVDPAKVQRLADEIRSTGVSEEPIWVARGSHVILNGHHRFAALKALGARRVPAWVVDYASDVVTLDRWTKGPPISKDEVVRRAESGELFPIQTTRHSFSAELPPHPTPLAELMESGTGARAAHAGRSRAARSASRG